LRLRGWLSFPIAATALEGGKKRVYRDYPTFSDACGR
jgi:hypothetical protein